MQQYLQYVSKGYRAMDLLLADMLLPGTGDAGVPAGIEDQRPTPTALNK